MQKNTHSTQVITVTSEWEAQNNRAAFVVKNAYPLYFHAWHVGEYRGKPKNNYDGLLAFPVRGNDAAVKSLDEIMLAIEKANTLGSGYCEDTNRRYSVRPVSNTETGVAEDFYVLQWTSGTGHRVQISGNSSGDEKDAATVAATEDRIDKGALLNARLNVVVKANTPSKTAPAKYSVYINLEAVQVVGPAAVYELVVEKRGRNAGFDTDETKAAGFGMDETKAAGSIMERTPIDLNTLDFDT